MGSYTRQDIKMTNDGDFEVGSDGDLSLASIDQTTIQDILLNTYTILGDFDAFPSIGSRLYKFIGEPNTRQNASLVQSEILRALTQNGYFSKEDLDISVVPISISTIVIYLLLRNSAGDETQQKVFSFDYIKGLQVES
jgi:hypothetical protein